MKKLVFAIVSSLLAISSQAAVVVSPTTLVTNESGGTVTYQVVLDVAPSAGETVTVAPSSNDVTEGTVSTALNFTDADWETPQLITVTPGASGDGNDGDVNYNITHVVSASGGTASYNGLPAEPVSVTNINIDGVFAILLEPAGGTAFFLDEGTFQTVTVSTTTAPTNDVSVDLSIAGSEATVSIATVTLTAGNSYTATFDVTAVADALIDADQAFTVITGNSVSSDPNYSGINLADIEGRAINIDVAPAPPSSTAVPTLPQNMLFLLAGLLCFVAYRYGYQRWT